MLALIDKARHSDEVKAVIAALTGSAATLVDCVDVGIKLCQFIFIAATCCYAVVKFWRYLTHPNKKQRRGEL